MFHVKKRVLLGIMAGVLAASMVFPSFAASRKAIKSITLSIKANIVPETDYGEEEIEIETTSNKFSVDGYEVLNDDHGWTEDSVPKIRIMLVADDDYYFQSLSKEKITLKGGAEYIKSTRQDGSSTLLMDVELPSLQTTMRTLGNVVLSDTGIATWDAVGGAGSYEVKVYREDKAVGASMIVNTNSCNCRERLTKGETSYTVKVRPVSKFDSTEKGEWAESPSIFITGDKAAEFRNNPTGGSGAWVQSQENGRWWYSNADGSYPANCWQQIGDKWYFFDAQGYMQTGWIAWEGKEYYCSENGDMLTNCMTPDNYLVGGDGAKVSQ